MKINQASSYNYCLHSIKIAEFSWYLSGSIYLQSRTYRFQYYIGSSAY